MISFADAGVIVTDMADHFGIFYAQNQTSPLTIVTNMPYITPEQNIRLYFGNIDIFYPYGVKVSLIG